MLPPGSVKDPRNQKSKKQYAYVECCHETAGGNAGDRQALSCLDERQYAYMAFSVVESGEDMLPVTYEANNRSAHFLHFTQ